MTQWREVALGEGVAVHHGFAFKGEYFATQGELIVLTPGNFIDAGGFKSKSGQEKYYNGPVPPGYLLSRGDVVVAMTEQAYGLLGSSATIPADGSYLHNQRLGLLRVTDPELFDLRFLYHAFNSPRVRSQIQERATGSKVRHTAPERIQAVKVSVPSVSQQRTIAGVLDSIDALIENNRRRVEVLEEMARAIYREWFVHLRYPGHESDTFIESPFGRIPEGWHYVDLGEVVELRYGKALKKENRRPGGVAVLGSSGVVGWHDEELISGPAIIIGRKGNVGSVSWVDGPCWPIDTTYFVMTDFPKRYVAEQLRRTEFLNTHAAVPGLSREQALSRPFLKPPYEVAARFEEMAETLARIGSSIAASATQLSKIRDLLLPKLVTGQIDVSSLDLDALVERSVE